MQRNSCYEESPSHEPEEIYEDLQDTPLIPTTSDEWQYPAEFLSKHKTKRRNKRKSILVRIGVASFAVLFFVALTVTVIFSTVRLATVNSELDKLRRELNNQSVLSSFYTVRLATVNSELDKLRRELNNQSMLQSSKFEELNTQRQSDKTWMEKMVNTTEANLTDLYTRVETLGQKYQKLLALREDCIKETRVCEINSLSVGLFREFYWDHCTTDKVFMNTSAYSVAESSCTMEMNYLGLEVATIQTYSNATGDYAWCKCVIADPRSNGTFHPLLKYSIFPLQECTFTLSLCPLR